METEYVKTNDNIKKLTYEEKSHHVTATESITHYINLIYPPILVTVGVTCNIIIILTMRTKYFRNVSTSVYLKTGAFNDGLALLISLVSHWIYVNFPSVYVRTDSSHAMCKFFNFYGSGNNDFGIMITASMTAERAIVVAAPLTAGIKCSVNRAWKVTAVILSVVIIKNCHYLFTSDIVPEGRTDRLCDVFPENHGIVYESFWLDFYPWFHLGYVASGGILIIVSNSIILYHVRKSTAQKHHGQGMRHIFPMLIGESILLILLTFPFTVHLALLSIRLHYDTTIYEDPAKASREQLVFSVTFYMIYTNKCANFFMYCVTGKRFRDGLRMNVNRCLGKSKRIHDSAKSLWSISTVTTKDFIRKSFRSHRRDRPCDYFSYSVEFDTDDCPPDYKDELNIELTERIIPSYSVYI